MFPNREAIDTAQSGHINLDTSEFLIFLIVFKTKMTSHIYLLLYLIKFFFSCSYSADSLNLIVFM